MDVTLRFCQLSSRHLHLPTIWEQSYIMLFSIFITEFMSSDTDRTEQFGNETSTSLIKTKIHLYKNSENSSSESEVLYVKPDMARVHCDMR